MSFRVSLGQAKEIKVAAFVAATAAGMTCDNELSAMTQSLYLPAFNAGGGGNCHWRADGTGSSCEANGQNATALRICPCMPEFRQGVWFALAVTPRHATPRRAAVLARVARTA